MTEENKTSNFPKGNLWIYILISMVLAFGIYQGVHYLIDARKSSVQWTAEDREAQVKECMQECKTNGIQDEQLARNYCECSQEKISKAFPKKDYNELMEKPMEEQIKAVTPIVQGCLDELRKSVSAGK